MASDIQRWLDAGTSRRFCMVSKSGTRVHISRGNDESLCGRLMFPDNGAHYCGAQDYPDLYPCAACWKIMEREAEHLPNLGGGLHEAEASATVDTNSPANSGAGEEGKAMTTYAERIENAEYVLVGAGKTPHIKGDEGNGKATACGKTVKGPAENPDLSKVCKACTAVIAKAYPLTEETETKGETGDMSTETKGADTKTREKIAELTETIRGLAEAGEDAERAARLKDDAETLIKSLPTGERNALRKALDTAFKGGVEGGESAPATAVAKREPKPDLETKDYSTVEGVTELVGMGAERIREGVAAHAKASSTARSVAEVILDMRLRIHNKNGLPDLKASSQAAKDAAGAMYKAAGEKLDGTDEEIRQAVASMVKATQYQMSDVLVGYVRALDNSPEEFAAHFGAVKEAHPDLKPSEAVFTFYKLSPKSELEKAKERQAAKKLSPEERLAITAGGGEVVEPEETGGEAIRTPGERVAEAAPERKAETFVESLTKLVGKFDASYFETIEDEDEKSKLEAALKDAEDKIKELRKALI